MSVCVSEVQKLQKNVNDTDKCTEIIIRNPYLDRICTCASNTYIPGCLGMHREVHDISHLDIFLLHNSNYCGHETRHLRAYLYLLYIHVH